MLPSIEERLRNYENQEAKKAKRLQVATAVLPALVMNHAKELEDGPYRFINTRKLARLAVIMADDLLSELGEIKNIPADQQ